MLRSRAQRVYGQGTADGRVYGAAGPRRGAQTRMGLQRLLAQRDHAVGLIRAVTDAGASQVCPAAYHGITPRAMPNRRYEADGSRRRASSAALDCSCAISKQPAASSAPLSGRPDSARSACHGVHANHGRLLMKGPHPHAGLEASLPACGLVMGDMPMPVRRTSGCASRGSTTGG